MDRTLHRREWLTLAAASTAALIARPAWAVVAAQAETPLQSFTGPGANPFWNSVGPYVTYPQKSPLLRLTDRPIQLETPRAYFRSVITPNEAFYVRYHLPDIPNAIDLKTWRLELTGNFKRPLQFSFDQLLREFRSVDIAAVNQCSGNSRSYFQPRVPGGQWGNGAMGNAMWTGVRLRDVLARAGIEKGTVQIQFEGLDHGPGPEGKGSHRFLKSWDVHEPILDEAIIAYAMNGEPLPMLNGFPVRLVMPGKFATYWTKHLTHIRALTTPDTNFWMYPAYQIPDTPNGSTTPEELKAGKVKLVPIGHVNMPVRSFIIDPDDSAPVVHGLSTVIRGIAFSGMGGIRKVEVSTDGGQTWKAAKLGRDLGRYSFREFELAWKPDLPGLQTLAVRATDTAGHVQPDSGVWNPGGYLWNKIERQQVLVLDA
ncbi:MAG: molybdopterin-dependent oxidoreductase [Thiomonas arsenitoxydans]|uniref:Molybdopterin-dependent oxidoreductase n=1 Tax=Thiomonas arsenitoxydans (strain DSM 22701 / CIP 110005 / 3As) TaxID=426114 RepID=A0A8I1SWC3_THIA3|nr:MULTISPECIES: molybdopterin-dependent oxidoreductase [Thiomonas]MBN8744488.1 molybdopterin-dependent oxidoreductase [Thiomonas arsenitoxydans]ODU97021.1 MAG: twin-arginine translocation pathway signal protein [Thiomonas sp. SCN 64-16]